MPDVEVDDPSGTARILVLGWGVDLRADHRGRPAGVVGGGQVAQAHLRNLNPFPANLGEVLRAYDRVLVPEMNLGQLASLLRAEYLVDARRSRR